MKPHLSRERSSVLASCAIAILTAACGGGEAAGARPPRPHSTTPSVIAVETATAVEREVATVIRATGSFVADEASDVTPLVAGSVVETPVNVGDVVKAGQVIVRLDPRNANLELQHAEALLQQAVAQANNAKVEAERHAALVTSGDISKSTYEKLTTQLTTAEAAVAQATARVASAKKAVDDTTIVAPFAGHVTARPVSVGEYVATSAKVVTIVRIQPIKLELQVPESDSAKLRRGMPVRAEVPTHPDTVFEGVVSALNVALDASSRAMAIEVRFPNADRRLLPGMFGTAEIHLPATERALFVPATAVASIANGQSSAVYVVDDTTARVRVVQVGERQDGMVRILAGLDGQAVVATSALTQLFDGATVRAIAPAAVRTVDQGQ
jgi:RND family efflux transporter MFP subunit